ncbi:malto-oligosyltrehalose trehalohydrolase [Plastoroseomonas arctica]|uniref:Malto-oligosyltrehalose trehalohydrolase n=1 Tax=Plastoroseomonas arctica TaxID=1509237 RepID=A0AAF1KI26_9PROT|nr:malto-oligosyltrehalose trehalohydrolase [Plastoroseomonas arctica]MBR0654629.1 malto-oligosyltrehalose trehalohydrolase [Plastoroseomonas arctica]
MTETRWGACLLGPAQARFRLWAPGAGAVLLERDGSAPAPMLAEADGWWSIETAAAAGDRYRYRVDGLLLPDPASRQQDGGVHDASVIVDTSRFAWKHADWRGRPWHETILYELHAGAMGGFRGVTEALPRLQALGVTAIELMPIAAFPGGRNWGYDGVLPFAPDSSLGTPEELAAMIDTAHGLGLMVFLDVVYNHFGPDGAYLHAVAKRFFHPEIHTPWGAAIAFDEPAVRAYFEENALYWLREFRFDGLRLDAVHAIADPDWLDQLARRLRAALPDRHIHLVLENEDNAARHLGADLFDAQWNDDGHNTLHRLLTGETEAYYVDYAEAPAEKLAAVLRQGFVFTGQHSRHREQPRGEPSAHLPPTAFVLFLQNHDQVGNRAFGERLAHLADADALAAATALLLLCPQIPMLFMGEEWGATAPFFFFTDHNAELAPLVRDGRRAEFAHFAAFQDEVRRESIPDPNDTETFARSIPDVAEAELPAHAAILARHRALLALRHHVIIPRLQGAQAIGADAVGEAAVVARWRLGDGAVLAIACNLGEAAVDTTLAGDLLHETRAGAAAALAAGRLDARCTVALLLDISAGTTDHG